MALGSAPMAARFEPPPDWVDRVFCSFAAPRPLARNAGSFALWHAPPRYFPVPLLPPFFPCHWPFVVGPLRLYPLYFQFCCPARPHTTGSAASNDFPPSQITCEWPWLPLAFYWTGVCMRFFIPSVIPCLAFRVHRVYAPAAIILTTGPELVLHAVESQVLTGLAAELTKLQINRGLIPNLPAPPN